MRPDSEIDYPAAWADYRARRRFFFLVWVGGFALAGGLIWALSAFQMAGKASFLLIPATLMFAFILAADRWSQFPCPRCGKRFTGRSRPGEGGKNTCPHCALPFGYVPKSD